MTITGWIRAMAAIFVLLPLSPQGSAQAKEYVTHFTHANGISIAYQDIGNSSGPAVVLIMGLSGQLIGWPQEFIDGLNAAGFRVIRFDNRDAGLSEKLYERGAPNFTWAAIKNRLGLSLGADYTLDDMAEDTVGLMDALEIDSAHVVGVSLGGMIAQLVAGHHPDRTRSLVSMMSTSGAEGLPEAREDVMALLTRPAPEGRDASIERTVEMMNVNNNGHPDKEALRAYATLAYDRCHYPPGRTRTIIAIWASGSRLELLKTLRTPTLVIHGTDDPLIPVEHGEDTAARIPGARLRLIQGMGHGLPQAHLPTVVQAVVEHVTAVEASLR